MPRVPARLLLDRLPADLQEFSARSLKGQPRGVVTREHLLELIAANLVEGIFRRGSFQYLGRIVDDQQYALALQEWYEEKGDLESIANLIELPGEVLRRMCSDRKTTFIERSDPGSRVRYAVFQHKTRFPLRFAGEAA